MLETGLVRIILVHNYHRSGIPSGEDTVFEAEARLLEDAGHAVLRWIRSNDEITAAPVRTGLTAGLLTGRNPFAAASLKKAILDFRPDVVHFHNTFPLLSPELLWTAHASGVATVASLHNYRTICASANLYRDQKICTDCLDRQSPWPGLIHGCYRQNRAASLPVALMISRHQHRQTFKRAADALIVLTPFQKELMIRTGIASALLHVKPNFTAAAEIVPWQERDDSVIFAGRVCNEKGIHTLMRAWHLLGDAAPKLKIVGAGPELPAIREALESSNCSRRIELLGSLPHQNAMLSLSRAKLLVFPSEWYEPFGMTVIEAFAREVPVLASRLGGLTNLVENDISGHHFEPGNAQSLADAVFELWGTSQLQQLAQGGYRRWQELYSPLSNRLQLEAIYRSARHQISATTQHPGS